jgi:hypothetical protein
MYPTPLPKKNETSLSPFLFSRNLFLDFVCYTLLILFAIHDELLLGFSICFLVTTFPEFLFLLFHRIF